MVAILQLGVEATIVDVALSLMKQKASIRLGANIRWAAPAGVVVMLDLVHDGPMYANMSTQPWGMHVPLQPAPHVCAGRRHLYADPLRHIGCSHVPYRQSVSHTRILLLTTSPGKMLH